MEQLRWGVLGVSNMVGRLAVLPAIAASTTSELVAVASRDSARAQSEAKLFGARTSYGSYDRLLQDPSVEAVYIPLPNSLHHVWTIACLKAGKHVLCEKPLAGSAAEAREMHLVADSSGRLLMEAHMTTFHSRYSSVLDLAAGGALGDLRHVRSQFSFINSDPGNHRWLPEMGGGALLDVGIYCLDPILRLAGPPLRVDAREVRAPSGVDSTFSAWLEWSDGLTASALMSFELPEVQRLELLGTEGSLIVEDETFTAGPRGDAFRLSDRRGASARRSAPANNSYLAMVDHFAAAARGETPLLRSLDQSVQCLELLDSLRECAGRDHISSEDDGSLT